MNEGRCTRMRCGRDGSPSKRRRRRRCGVKHARKCRAGKTRRPEIQINDTRVSTWNLSVFPTYDHQFFLGAARICRCDVVVDEIHKASGRKTGYYLSVESKNVVDGSISKHYRASSIVHKSSYFLLLKALMVDENPMVDRAF